MGRANPVALRLRILRGWPGNVRHAFLSAYVKHIFQHSLVAPPAIRASTSGIWVSLTLLDADKSAMQAHPLLRDKKPSIDFKHIHSFTPAIMGRHERRVANLLHGMERQGPRGRKGGRLAWLRDKDNNVVKDESGDPLPKYQQNYKVINADFKSLEEPDRPRRFHHYYGKLAGYDSANPDGNANPPPLNMMDALGARKNLLPALHIFRDQPVHFSFNIIRNPVLSASITAQYVAREVKDGVPLAKIHKTLLENLK
ncbi:MAG: hypothetical protein SGCHY_004067 [Lobulomycetales sp.]